MLNSANLWIAFVSSSILVSHGSHFWHVGWLLLESLGSVVNCLFLDYFLNFFLLFLLPSVVQKGVIFILIWKTVLNIYISPFRMYHLSWISLGPVGVVDMVLLVSSFCLSLPLFCALLEVWRQILMEFHFFFSFSLLLPPLWNGCLTPAILLAVLLLHDGRCINTLPHLVDPCLQLACQCRCYAQTTKYWLNRKHSHVRAIESKSRLILMYILGINKAHNRNAPNFASNTPFFVV